MRLSGLIFTIGMIPLAALPAVAGSVSFSFNMTGVVRMVPIDGGFRGYLQPLTGAIAPFGPGVATFTPSTGPDTVVFTLGNGMTITASIVPVFGATPTQYTLNGTITDGTGVFQGASGSFTSTLTSSKSNSLTTIPQAFTGSGTLNAPIAPSGLSLLPSVLTFHLAQGVTAPASQNLVLDNQSFNAQAFQVSVATTSGGNWLSASPGSGSAPAETASNITVTANPAAGGGASSPGIYEGQVTATYGSISVLTKVHLIVGGMGENLLLSETGLTFQGGVGGSASHAQSILVEDTGVGSLAALTAATSVTGGGANWLHAAITPHSGNPQASTATISVSPLPAIAGTYYGRVDFSLPGAANSPQSVPVVLQVLAGALPDITPGHVVLGTTFVVGDPGVPVAPQTVRVYNLATHPVSFTLTGGSNPPQNRAPMSWLVFSPTSANMGAGSYATFTVSVPSGCFAVADPCWLQMQMDGGIHVNFLEDSYIATIPVNLTVDNVMGAIGINPQLRLAPKIVAACTPQFVNGGFTSLLAGFKATVGVRCRSK